MLKASLLKKPTIKKPKLLRSNPHRFTSIRFQGVDPSEAIDDEDVYIAYRRPEIEKDFKVYGPDDELPKDILWKLFLARQVAMLKYREVSGQERT